jgi:hypothetical protein
MNETIISNPPPDVPLTPPEEKKSNNTLLIVIIVLLVLCCCCVCLSLFGGLAWTNGDRWFNLGSILPLMASVV